MCGIVGYVGGSEAASDSPGRPRAPRIPRLRQRRHRVLSDDGELHLAKDAGKLANLRDGLLAMPQGHTGIGHTRWATHGKATQINAHPHTDVSGDVVVIHNGIVENYRELRDELILLGHLFTSETDTEVIPHLISEYVLEGKDLENATRMAMRRIEGAAAVLAMRRQEPGRIVAARVANAGGVVIGHGVGEMIVASDLPAIAEHTDRVVFLDDGEVAVVTAGGATYSRLDGKVIEKSPQTLPAGSYVSGKGAYEHYLAKEIAEQPESILNTLRGAVSFDPPSVNLDDVRLSQKDIAALDRVVLIGMGTSLHSAQIGRTYIEQLGGLPAEVDNASEYRYREPIIDSSTLVIAVAQSGETVDTLAAMHEAKRRGAKVIAVCNTPGSQATRIGDGTVFMRCGPEVAVCSTKTFLGSLTALYVLACYLGQKRGHLSEEALGAALDDLARMPSLVGEALKTEDTLIALAERFYASEHFLFLGRGLEFSVAMEGALKLKEVSYIHAEGYSAGEMKHGPIALIDSKMPVVAIAVRDQHYAKMMSNIEEVRAREGIVIALATVGDEGIREKATDVVFLPEAPVLLQPMITTVPLQILAYHIARLRGCDIDQPRNLAKTVTVE